MKHSFTFLALGIFLITVSAFADSNRSHKKAQAAVEALDNPADEQALQQAQDELEQSAKDEQTAEEKVVTKTDKKSADKKEKVATQAPQLLDTLTKNEDSGADYERQISRHSPGDSVSAKQANADVKNARETLREYRKELHDKKHHVKSKEEIAAEKKQKKEDEEYKKLVNKAYKEHSGKQEKYRVVHTKKGNVRVVFLNENDFGADERHPSDAVSPELRQAIINRGREPANVDNEIDSAGN